MRDSVLAFAVLVFLGAYFLLPYSLSPPILEKMSSLAFFALLSYGAGYTVTLGNAFAKDRLELHIMRAGTGVATLPLLIVILDTVRIPLSWPVPLILSLIYPAYHILAKKKEKTSSSDETAHWALVAAAAAFTLALAGSFAYPYLEDGDSWEHAAGAAYVAAKHTYTTPPGQIVSHYLPPYPPAYDTLLGLIHQLNTSVSWTLKTYNAMLVGLTVVFAYCFVREFTGNRKIALYYSIFLTALPCFGSHAIWAHTLAVATLYPFFYCVVKRMDKAAAVAFAGCMITQPLTSAVIGVFYALYVLAQTLTDRRQFKRLAAVGAAGLAISMIYWLPALTAPARGDKLDGAVTELTRMNLRIGFVEEDRAPGLTKLLLPKTSGDIYMMEGFGLAYCILVVMGWFSLFKDRKPWTMTALLWTLFAFAALESYGLPISIYPGRFWGLVPVGASILAAKAADDLGRRYGRSAALAAVALVLATSGYYKVVAQTDQWPTDIGEVLERNVQGYVNLVAFPPNTMVYPLCMDDKYVLGMDKMSPPWDPEVTGFRDGIMEKSQDELNAFLAKNGYEYAIFDAYCYTRCAAKKDSETCKAEFAAYTKDLMKNPKLKRIYKDEKTGMFKVVQ